MMEFEIPHSASKRLQRKRTEQWQNTLAAQQEAAANAVDEQGRSLFPGNMEAQVTPPEEQTDYDQTMNKLLGSSLLGRSSTWTHPLLSRDMLSPQGLLAAFFPCISVGRITTMLEREEPKVSGMGHEGLKSCAWACVLGALAPIPCLWPGLSLQSFLQRRQLLTMYNFYPPLDDDDDESYCSCKNRHQYLDQASGCLCVPCSLNQEYTFLTKETSGGTLRFPWENENSWDVTGLTALPSFKVLIMGDKQCGKSALFNRLLGKSFQGDDYKEDSSVNVGFRLFTNMEKVPAGTIEFWDVPTDEYKLVEPLIFRNVHVVVFVMTMMKEQSFKYIKDIYTKITERRNEHSDKKFRDSMGRRMRKPVPCVVVTTKCDLFDEKGCKYLADLDSFIKTNNITYVRCSNRTGLGVPRVYKSIMHSLVVRRSSIEPINTVDEEHKTDDGVISQAMIR